MFLLVFTGTFVLALVPILAMSLLSKRKNQFPVTGRTVILTGASQGMGRGVAKLLAQKGANVAIVARDLKKLDAALEYIRQAAASSPSQRFIRISADLTKYEENIRVIEEVTKWNGGQPPDIVWAIAGTSIPKLFLDADIKTLRDQMDINYWAGAFMAQASLKAWFGPYIDSYSAPPPDPKAAAKSKEKPPPRHVILTSSSAAFVGVTGYGIYSPPKAALRSLCDNVQSELNLYHGAFASRPSSTLIPQVKIHTVFPGNISSPGHAAEDLIKHPVTFALEKDDPMQSEDEVAAAAVAGLERGDYLIMTNWLGHLMRWGTMSGSPRNGWGLLDTVMSWIVNVAWLFIGPDMERTVWKWGKANGIYGKDGRKG
ncbi:NAD(P)-binding protein [Rhizodiscina lignyota]|uniref:3-dehydrosphinganine reductase n=1 Tax=Rhizodiscina lignyota TaxID=1504668 RepID=A0A9P4I8L9_9PEZI|nr:NAD(P)-binding protein [Rhizodiscina lignyota]